MKGQFTPWLYAVAAQIRQVSLQEMALDATVMASGVIDAGKLFNSQMLCLNFDLTVWAEAAGATTNWETSIPTVAAGGSADPNPDVVRESARIATLVEAAKRVKGAMPKHTLACAIAGPATLAALLELDEPDSAMTQFTVGELITEYVNVLCEAKVDNIVILEGPNVGDEALAPWVEGGQYVRIAKLAQHYSVATLLLCPEASLDENQVEEFDSLDYVIAQPEKTIAANLTHAVKGITVDDFGSGSVGSPAGLDMLAQGSYFLTTAWDLEPGLDFSTIQQDITTASTFLEGV